MTEPARKLEVTAGGKSAASAPRAAWEPFESLRRQIDRAFEDFGSWRWPFSRSAFEIEPLWRRELRGASPAVDIVEKDKEYEITAELPGIEEKDVEVKLTNDVLTIRGEKQEHKEEKKKDYYLSERHFGSFQRAFRVPEGIDPDKVEAAFKNGVLTVTLPKTPEAQKKEKKIQIKVK
jgi:HSP20 family protein